MAARSLTGQADQLALFADPSADKHRALDKAVDHIIARFGKSAVRRGMGSE